MSPDPLKSMSEHSNGPQYPILLYALNPVFFKKPILRMPRRARGTQTCVRFPNRSAWPRRRVADDTRLTTHEGTPDLGLSRIFNDFSTFTQSSQTHGVYFPRHQKHYETQSFSEKNPTGRRSSTSPWESHPSSRRLATYG